MSLRTVVDRIWEKDDELRRLEALAGEELERIRTEWLPEQIFREMPASLIVEVLR